MRKLIVLLVCSFLLCGCISININIGNNNHEVVKELSSEEVKNSSYEDLGKEATDILEKENISKDEEGRVKSIFLTLTDFLFNDGEIKGKTFKELSLEAKSKFYDMYYKIANMMEEKYPNYKEEVPARAKEMFSNLKDKIGTLKKKIKDEYREYVGEEQYQMLEDSYESSLENLSEVYDIYKPYIDETIDKGKSVYQETKDKAYRWYQDNKER